MVYVYGLFKPSLVLELCLNALQESVAGGDKLQVVTLEPNRSGGQKLLDTMYSADGMSLIDGIAIGAAVGMVLGVIYGSVVFIGPVAVGLIGMAAGGGLGYMLDRMKRCKKREINTAPAGEVIIVVGCAGGEEALRVEEIMREHRAAALGRGPAPETGETSGK